jgi:diguanylate cyclase (GGDEF)-like protein
MNSLRPTATTVLLIAAADRQTPLAQQLEALGYSVIIAAAADSQRPSSSQRYDLVLIDRDSRATALERPAIAQLAQGVPVLTLEHPRGVETWTEETLAYRISAALSSRSPEDVLAERERRWAGLNVLDPQTRLFSRAYFDAIFPIELERARRVHQPLSLLLLLIDIPADADALWPELSGRLLTSVRQTDLVARYGEREVLMLLPFTEAALARVVAARIGRTIEAALGSRLTVASGVAGFPQHGMSAEAVILAAYHAAMESQLIPR